MNPNICSGKPCIRDKRIWVFSILDFLANVIKIEEIIEEDKQAAIDYGAEMSRERYVELPIVS